MDLKLVISIYHLPYLYSLSYLKQSHKTTKLIILLLFIYKNCSSKGENIAQKQRYMIYILQMVKLLLSLLKLGMYELVETACYCATQGWAIFAKSVLNITANCLSHCMI